MTEKSPRGYYYIKSGITRAVSAYALDGHVMEIKGNGRSKMDIQKILKQVDSLFAENKGQEAEKLMLKCAAQAVDEQDDGCLLQLLNELLGYYRETSQWENSFRIATQAIALAEHMDLKGTLPYATTLLNVATVYRAGGRLQESLEYYLEVEELYYKLLPADNMYIASLENNLSLLYQELGDYAKAKECQLKALEISEKNHSDYEVAVTCTNLAATCAQLEEREEFHQYALRSTEIFRRIGAVDSHYAAALATLGLYYLQRQEYDTALGFYRQAMEIVERGVGRNEAYRRLQEYVAACQAGLTAQEAATQEAATQQAAVQVLAGNEEPADTAVQIDTDKKSQPAPEGEGKGLALCRAYYETFGKPMISKRFPGYESRIAVGLVGKGSDCFGFDDAASEDHDWGPGFCMWLTDETYDSIGEALQEAYNGLPMDFEGYHRAPDVNAKNRRGVMRISDFYRKLLGTDCYEGIDWRQVQDHNLAEAVNGSVFRDDEGIFSAFREKLSKGYPEEIRLLKLAESAASFSQAIQYNFPRMWNRGDGLTAHMLAWDGMKAAMKLQHYIQEKYPPHDKWLYRSLQQSEANVDLIKLMEDVAEALEGLGYQVPEKSEGQDALEIQKVAKAAERLGAHFAKKMYGLDIISDIDPYLDHHSQELVYKASLSGRSREELVEEIARLEFEAFDKVKNEGGRASCQNDWPTFSIMRKSQYLTWNRTMLTQYLFDFYREYHLGHNLIEEKYGRMMESTAPERYEEIKDHFPKLTEAKKAIIEQVCSMQVGWMEEFAKEYPALADNARSIHTYEDNPFDTSYETYLRGELSTYSDKMLELYGRYIVGYARSAANLAMDIMENNVRMYGYKSIEEAERRTAAAWQGKGGRS